MSYLSTNDLDLFVHSLLQDRILFSQNPLNFGGKDYIPYQFAGGKVIDNWGVDLFIGDNLQELNNEVQTEYLVTYRRDNFDLYSENCSKFITYDFSVMMKDCPNSKSRLNLILDELINYMIDPDKIFGIYQKVLTTRIDYGTSALIDNKKYSTNLKQNEILKRIDCQYEELTAKSTKANFLTSIFTIKLQIN